MKIYHYTNLKNLMEILSDGLLRVSRAEKKMKVAKPALWWSSNPVFEKTVMSIKDDDGNYITDVNENARKIGVVRFVKDWYPDFVDWRKYRQKTIKDGEQIHKGMELQGIKLGADPKEWYAIFKSVKVSSCEIEIYVEGEWVEFNEDNYRKAIDIAEFVKFAE
jgi:hypothetical protein